MLKDLHDLYRRLHPSGGADDHDDDAADDDDDDALAVARELGAEATAAGAEVVVVSACLLGERTRYDGGDKLTPAVVDPLCRDPRVRVLPLCPEILGGMGCPRPPVAFAGGVDAADPALRALDDRGVDRTAELRRGAARAEALAAAAGASRAVLKERSPSCGPHRVHAAGGVVPGRGMFAARLADRLHLRVVSEEDVLQQS
jgi:uncharacterized protein YbbK (DUF523 family)